MGDGPIGSVIQRCRAIAPPRSHEHSFPVLTASMAEPERPGNRFVKWEPVRQMGTGSSNGRSPDLTTYSNTAKGAEISMAYPPSGCCSRLYGHTSRRSATAARAAEHRSHALIRLAGSRWANLVASVCVLVVISAVACQGDTPVPPTVPPLTAPPPDPTVSASAIRKTAEPANPTSAPTPTVTATPDPVAAPIPASPPAIVTPVPALPAATSADAAHRLNGLIDRLLEPREVKADAVWSSFIASRAAVLSGIDEVRATETQVRMLEMWHSGDDCYAALEDEVEALGPDRYLTLIEYPQFLDYAHRHVSPCLEERLPQIDPARFFAHPAEVRTERITRWFDAAWQQGSGELGDLAPTCRGSFYAYLPDVVDAADLAGFGTAWNAALQGQVQCLLSAMQDDLRYLMDPAALFELPAVRLSEMIALHTTITGHILALGMGRNYDDCWPDFEARIPAVAESTTLDEMSVAQNAAMESLAQCVQDLPFANRFSDP